MDILVNLVYALAANLYEQISAGSSSSGDDTP